MERFARISALLHRYQGQCFRNFGPLGNPHRGQGRVLSLLRLKPDISQKELSYLLDMRSQSLGELLNKLERSGYITRTPSEEDRRVMNVHLTPEGTAAAEQQTSPAESDLFECLSAEEREQLLAYLDRIIAALETATESIQDEREPFPPHGREGFPLPPHGRRPYDFPDRKGHPYPDHNQDPYPPRCPEGYPSPDRAYEGHQPYDRDGRPHHDRDREGFPPRDRDGYPEHPREGSAPHAHDENNEHD